jgi:D-glycero-alpha-D-manno-heptose-7-phosphate kinase
MPSKEELARIAIHIEQDVLQEAVGCQDQVMAAHGGLCRVNFFQNGEIGYTPIVMNPERLALFQDHLLLYFTGFSRTASEIAKEQIERTKQRRVELFAMLQLVQEGVSVLVGERDLSEFGELLHEAWMVKRSLTSKITTPLIDEIYEAARRAGALGGKLLGAGGGGFMLLFAKPEIHGQIRSALPGLLEVPFRFEALGSQIVFYQQETPLPRDTSWHDERETALSPRSTPMSKAA